MSATKNSPEGGAPSPTLWGLGMSNAEMLREIVADGRLAVEVRKHLAHTNYEGEEET